MSNQILKRVDWVLLPLAVFLACWGILMIVSAANRSPQLSALFSKQLLALGLGLLGMFFLMIVNYQVFRQWWLILYGLNIGMLILVLLIGKTIRGSQGWFELGLFSFQPAELAKLLVILSLSSFIDRYWDQARTTKIILGVVIIIFSTMGLILLQPDFSSAIVFIPLLLIYLFIAGIPLLVIFFIVLFGLLAFGIPLLATFLSLKPALLENSLISFIYRATTSWFEASLVLIAIFFVLTLIYYFLFKLHFSIPLYLLIVTYGVISCGVLASGGVNVVLKEYQRKRLLVFLDSKIDPLGAGYNVRQAKIAIGSGGLVGKGLFSGTQSQLGFLPERHTDFIFAVLGEETGFFGSLFFLLFYLIFLWRIIDIARLSRDRFGSLVAVGIAAVFAFSSIVNIGMVMGIMPVTGLPLPLFSYGGSSLLVSFLLIGLLLSIYFRRFTY
ncbi:MAG: rod shape-determining protein RodA [Elusimicrobiota bacterium]